MRTILLLLCITYTSLLGAQDVFWSTVNEDAILLTAEEERQIIPQHYHTVSLDLDQLKNYLREAPMERTAEARTNPIQLALPMPDGTLEMFNIYESPTMKPGLAARYPMIKSYAGRGINNTSLSVKFVSSPKGFHAVFNTPQGQIYIDPYASNRQDIYQSYFVKDQLPADHNFVCGVDHEEEVDHQDDPFAGMTFNEEITTHAQANARGVASEPVMILEYKMAMACTAEWATLHGGTVAGALASMNVAVNRINSIYEPELAIRFTLIDNNDVLVFTDPVTDPYNNVTLGTGLLQQNQDALDMIVGNASYDIGHVMTIGCTDVGGVASGQVCVNSNKGRGVTCQAGPNLEAVIVRVACHEVGHQFNAGHSWSNCPGSLQQLAPGSAFEPGSGTTIMSYSGACGNQNIQFGTDEYFHVGSLDQMYTHSRVGQGSECVDLLPSNNNTPDLEIPWEDGFFIPISTPFELTAIASDPEEDDLTYCWEQYNLGPLSDLGTPFLNAPSFRSFLPTESPTRVFPRLPSIIFNTTSDVEVLPTYTRNLKFRCTVRDNNPEIGGVVWEEVSFEATDEAGPFTVTYPSNSVEWKVGDYLEVTWDVANTDGALVNCQNVNIKLSTDGGYTYPVTLAGNVPNDGSHFITVPDQLSNTARVKIEAADNIFFDISNINFQIVPPTEAGYALTITPLNQVVCSPDPAIINLNTLSLLDYDSLVSYTVTGLPAGAEANFSSNPALVTEGSLLTIETDNITANGTYEIVIETIAPDADTLTRTVSFSVVLSDFSAVAPQSPVSGSSGISELPEFTWTGSPFADSYEIQIATNPSFAPDVMLESTSGITGTTYTPTILLEKNTLYFWRIKAQNSCRESEFSAIQAFHTEVFSCSDFISNDIPIAISNIGTPTIQSTLPIVNSGTISDINITKLKGTHDAISHISVSLTSPEETEVLLFSNICPTSTAFNVTLDDEAPQLIGCPPLGIYQPQGNLSDFIGENPVGTWTLELSVINTDGVGGDLLEWGLQICANASTNPPFLVNNNTLPLPTGATRQISTDFLLSEDADNGPEELYYTLVTAPENGTLFFQDEAMEVGDKFRQLTIDAGNLSYQHDGSTAQMDQFTFTVTDGEGGWFGIPQFNMEVDEDIIISTNNIDTENELYVSPNPAQQELTLSFRQAINNQIELSIVNVQGQILLQDTYRNFAQQLQLNTRELANGIYFLQVRTGEEVYTKRVVIQR